MPPPDEQKAIRQQLETLRYDSALLQRHNRDLTTYVRAKVDQLLKVMGTLPLRPEELDDQTLLALDPIGIISDSFTQVLEHLQQTNDELRIAQQELQAVFDATGAAILVLDAQLHLYSCNPAAIERFGIDVQSSVGSPLLKAIPGGVPLLSAEFLNQLAGDSAVTLDVEMSFAGYCYHLIASPVHDLNDHLWFYVLIFSDITERKRTENSLLETEARLSAIFNTMLAGILIIDPLTHRIVDVNHVAEQLIGEARAKIIGSVCHCYVCPSQQGQCPLTDLHQRMDSADRILITADKRLVPILKTATMIELSGKEYILESFIDIGDRKAAERALRDSERRYRSLYSAMKEGVAIGELIYDVNGMAVDYVLHDVNPACAAMFRQPLAALIGARASALYRGARIPYLEQLAAVVASGTPQESEIRVRPLGKTLHVSATRPQAQRFACILNDVTASRRAQKEIERLAYYDTLTGLPNRVLIKDRLQQAMAQADRSRSVVGVLALDLDHFKKINDSLGVGGGDRMLKIIARRLHSHLRQGDSIARMGGDEFVIVLTGNKNQQGIVSAAAKVLDLLSETVTIDDHQLVCTGSMGIVMYPVDCDSVDLLLKNADTAMYQAKETGRNLYQFYTPDMNTRAFERLFLDSDLHRAIQRDELEVYYQPQIDLRSGTVVGAEALLRWNHSQKGQISPVIFIPLAEESDLILEIGQWVLERACAEAKGWYDSGWPVRVAVNLSGRQFRSELPQLVAEVLQHSQLPPQLLELELTESLLMEKPEMARGVLKRLHALGSHLAIDDFGTGYSSLSYLKNFPLDRLKIDRSFVKDLGTNNDDATIVEAIIALAHGLRLKVVAEGVETAAQLAFMHKHDCDEVQGFYLARPMTAGQFRQFLGEFRYPVRP